MDYFGIKWTAMQMYLYLWMDVLRKKLFVHASLSNYWTVCNYVPVEFYLFKLYHKGANIYWVNDKITPSVIHTQCDSVFCGPVPHTSFTYIYSKPQPLTPWNVTSFYK